VFPVGIWQLKRLEAVVRDPDCTLPALIVAECQDLLAQTHSSSTWLDCFA